MSRRTVSDAVFDVLGSWNIRHVFTCPGSTEAAFLEASVGRAFPDLVLTTHESVAISMADGYARATGEPSLAYVHANVGLTNALSHLYAAQLAHSPTVVLNGLKARSVQANDGFTTARQTGDLTAPYVKSRWQSLAAEAIPNDVNNALRVATAEPSGPTWVGLAQDLMEAQCAGDVRDANRFRIRARTRPDPELVAEAAAILADAQTPGIVAGAEVARHGASAGLIRLAETLGAIVFNEDRRTYERPAFPSSHPQYAGLYHGSRASVAQCDVLLFVGCRCFMDFEPTREPAIPPRCQVIHSHVDPTELGRMYGFDVGLIGDEGLVISDILAALPDDHQSAALEPRLSAARAEWNATFVDSRSHGGRVSVNDVAESLASSLHDATVVVDATTSTPQLLRYLPQHTPQSLFTTASGSLGWGMGAALGLKLGMPERRVVAVGGDGVFQFGIQALWVAQRHQIPVTFVVINNQSYAAVAAALTRFGGRAAQNRDFPCKDLSGVHIAQTAASFGLASTRVDRASDIAEAIAVFGRNTGPTLVEIMTDPDDLGLALTPGIL